MNRHWVPDELYDIVPDDLSHAGRSVYAAICRCVAKGVAKPSTARLARMLAVSVDTVQRAIEELESAGMLNVLRRRGAASVYRVLTPDVWNVRLTSRCQRPVDEETSRTEAPNQPHGGPEPAAVSGSLGSTAGRTAGNGAVAVAEPKQGPSTASEARAAVETILRETAARMAMAGGASTRPSGPAGAA